MTPQAAAERPVDQASTAAELRFDDIEANVADAPWLGLIAIDYDCFEPIYLGHHAL